MKPIFFIAFILFAARAAAQDLNKLLFYDKDWKPAKPKKAVYILERKYINDTLWEWNYYRNRSPRYLSVQYKDENGAVMNGQYTTYTNDGYIDTSGYYRNGKRYGEWGVMASNQQLLNALFYRDGQLIATKDSNQVNLEIAKQVDSLEKNTKIFAKVEVESEFPGGAGSWSKYMRNNLRYPEESLDNNIMGDVIIQFIVDKQGYVTDVGLTKSAEYYLDKEALRLISNSPPWQPAMQDGRPVKSYKKQPVYFRFTR